MYLYIYFFTELCEQDSGPSETSSPKSYEQNMDILWSHSGYYDSYLFTMEIICS